jgi:hypothetical protein
MRSKVVSSCQLQSNIAINGPHSGAAHLGSQEEGLDEEGQLNIVYMHRPIITCYEDTSVEIGWYLGRFPNVTLICLR